MNYVIKEFLKDVRAVPWMNRAAVRTGELLVNHAHFPTDYFAKYLPPMGAISTRLPNGATLMLWSEADSGDDQVARYIFWKGWLGLQPYTTLVFWNLALRGGTVLDIGAHVGYYALLASLANPSSSVFAFEPHPFVFERLEKNISINESSNISILRAAVGDTSGSAPFYYIDHGLPSSSSLSKAFMDGSPESSRLAMTTVPVLRIDEFIRQEGIDRVNLVKIDTETTEPLVLKGMMKALERDRPDVICEVLSGYGVEQRIEEILRPVGYRFYALTNRGPVEHARIQPDTEWRDWLFTMASPEIVHNAVSLPAP